MSDRFPLEGSPFPPHRGDREWEPHWEAKFNLLIGNYLLESRAIQQILIPSLSKAISWLSMGQNAKETLVLATIHPFHVPFSYLIPFLDQYATNLVAILPSSNMNTLGVWDSSSFGAKASFVSATNVGFDCRSIVQDTIHRAEDAGGGIVLLPTRNDSGPWNRAYYSGGLIVASDGVEVIGLGKKITQCKYEPTAASTAAFIEFNNSSSTRTTQVACAARRFSVHGFDPNEMAGGGANKHKKVAIRTVCSSEMIIEEIGTQFWNTGSTYYGSEGPSWVWESQGKELVKNIRCSFNADRLIHIMKNPKEPGYQIDCDGFHFDTFYGIMPNYGQQGGDGYAIVIDQKLYVQRFKMSGVNIIAGGSGGLYWYDPNTSGSFDATGFIIEHLATEQMNNPNEWTIKISRQAGTKTFGVRLQDINGSVSCGGISLEGTYGTVIDGGQYINFNPTAQATSPKALKIVGNTRLTDIRNYYVPYVTGGTSLIDVGTQVATRLPASGYAPRDYDSQLPPIVSYTNA